MAAQRQFKPDPPLDDVALRRHADRLKMRVWQDPHKDGLGFVFCRSCGYGGDVRVSLAKWAADPIGCLRYTERSCDGRPTS